MKNHTLKTALALLTLCTAVFAQNPKLLISVSGELQMDWADVLMDGISYGLKNNDNYEILINDRQFKETLKKEWKKGNISDDRIIALAQKAGADYICFTKIKSVKGLKGKQVTAQVYNLNTMSNTEKMGMVTIKDDFSDLEHLTKIILNVVADMLGTAISFDTGSSISLSTMTDPRDKKQYKIVTIDDQTWMAENLGYNASGSKCYDNRESSCKKYGRLYNWKTAKKACPAGWHLPSIGEWQALVNYAGGDEVAGQELKAAKGWNYTNDGESGNGTDEFGFSALPSGFGFSDGSFNNVGYFGYWWSATEHDTFRSSAWQRYIHSSFANVSRDSYNKSFYLSVRCIKD